MKNHRGYFQTNAKTDAWWIEPFVGRNTLKCECALKVCTGEHYKMMIMSSSGDSVQSNHSLHSWYILTLNRVLEVGLAELRKKKENPTFQDLEAYWVDHWHKQQAPVETHIYQNFTFQQIIMITFLICFILISNFACVLPTRVQLSNISMWSFNQPYLDFYVYVCFWKTANIENIFPKTYLSDKLEALL